MNLIQMLHFGNEIVTFIPFYVNIIAQISKNFNSRRIAEIGRKVAEKLPFKIHFKTFLFLIDILVLLDFTVFWHKKIARLEINLI